MALLMVSRPVSAQVENGITSPAAGEVVSGVVIIQGSAGGSSFLRYEVAFNGGGDWIVFAEGDQPVENGTLAIWDTTVGAPNSPVYPDGVYQLRLRVVRQDFNYSEHFVSNITIANQSAVPADTATPPGTPDGAATPVLPANTAVPATAGSGAFPTTIPSLTPFPTPSPAATARVLEPEGAGGSDGTGTVNDGEQGLLAQLQAIDTGRFVRAFRQGIMISFYLFIGLGFYLILRRMWRWMWRKVRE